MNRHPRLWRHPFMRIAAAAALLALPVAMTGQPNTHALAAAHPSVASTCQLNSANGAIQHVIYIQFDNTHLWRDNPNVPSDLEQMPHLLNFITGNGVMIRHHHTPLIAHTATDILTALTGVYPDRHGVPISNSFRYFNPDGTSNPGVSFAYWTDPIFDPSTMTPTDTQYNMLTANGKNAPAPWVPYTRAGCNVGAVATANTVLENTATDIPTVFGANSPQAAEVASNPNQAFADFVGIAVHCAQGAALCSSANGGEADKLPNEPGGYNGYMGLFGHKYVAPQISPGGPLTDLNGNPISNTTAMTYGFPGFDGMSAAVSLSYVAAMQEHGVPITYAYISDAHDNHSTDTAYGPGEAGYVAQLKSYDDAFNTFFTRLANDGITKSNTLFVFTADEGDHFVGGPPSPANCDGVTVPCTYSQIGEINANMAGLLATEQNVTTPFKVHSDSAPNVYITGNPGPTDPTTRNFERATAKLTAVNPISGNTDKIMHYMADPVEMKLLHMITADPARTPTFTLFADPNYFLFAGSADCSSPCVQVEAGFAWNHGDVATDINTTWLGLVGPGIKTKGMDSRTWSDHTDIRPTMMALLGLKDDYIHDGRVLVEEINPSALPAAIASDVTTYQQLAQVYKQMNASVGALALASLQVSTVALESNNTNDATYTELEGQLSDITTQRDGLAAVMKLALEGAAFYNKPLVAAQAQGLIAAGDALIGRTIVLAAGT